MRRNIREIVLTLLIALTFFAPYMIEARQLLGGTTIRLISSFWSLVSYSSGPFVLEFVPMILTIYALPWTINWLFTLLDYYAIGRGTLTRGKYVGVVLILLIAQIGYFIYLMLANTGPLLILTPTPLVGVLAFMATPYVDEATP